MREVGVRVTEKVEEYEVQGVRERERKSKAECERKLERETERGKVSVNPKRKSRRVRES